MSTLANNAIAAVRFFNFQFSIFNSDGADQ